MTAMQRSFRSRGGLPWWWWRHHADRRARNEDGGVPPVDPLDAIFGAISGWYPVTLQNTFTNILATTPCTADGDLVAAWTATKGGLPMLIQATSGSRPVLKDDGGGRWRIDVASGKLMLSAATVTIEPELFFAAAISRVSASSGNILRCGTASNMHGLSEVASGDRLSGSYRLNAGTTYTAQSASSAFPLLSTKYVVSSKLTAAQLSVGKDKGTPVVVAAVTGTSASQAIAVSPLSTISYWGMAVHRAATVTDADRAAIVTALAALQGRSI